VFQWMFIIAARLFDRDPKGLWGPLCLVSVILARMVPSPTWLEINLNAIRGNVRRLRELAGSADVMAVVKANAYGHGAVEVSRAAAEAGAAWLGVGRAKGWNCGRLDCRRCRSW
jgi:hypothetical protein